MKCFRQVIATGWLVAFCLVPVEVSGAPAAQPKLSNPLSGTVTGGFKFAGYDQQNRLNSLIMGESLKPVPENRALVLITRLRLESYREDGQLEMVAEAPECVFDISTRIASSAGRLTAHTADQRLSISGDGFFYQQTNSSLVISNNVHTLIRRDSTNVPPTSPPGVPRAPLITVEKPLEVFAKHFKYDMPTRQVTYTGNVRVDDLQMELTSRWLRIQLAPKGGSFEQISAHENVVIFNKADQSRATGEQALYTKATERVELTGQPVWQQGLRSGSAKRLVMDRESRSFIAEEEVKMKLPRESLGQGGGLLGAPAPTTRQARSNSFVELSADFFQTYSNITVFRGAVRGSNDTTRLSCGLLTLQAATKTDSNETVTAQHQVVVEQGNARVTGDQAVYSRATGEAVFTGQPHWKMDQREGRAEKLSFLPQSNYFRASGNAYVKLQLVGATATNSFLPAMPPLGTNLLTTNLVRAPGKTNSAVPKWVEITAHDLEIKDRFATFEREVRVRELPTDGVSPRLQSELLHVTFATNGNQAEKIVASGKVLLEKGKPGEVQGPGAYQRMQAGVLIAELATNGVLDRVIAQKNVILKEAGTDARGEQAIYTRVGETMVLTGKPTARTPELVITQAEALIWDRANNKFSATGPYQMQTLKDPLVKSNAAPGTLEQPLSIPPPP